MSYNVIFLLCISECYSFHTFIRWNGGFQFSYSTAKEREGESDMSDFSIILFYLASLSKGKKESLIGSEQCHLFWSCKLGVKFWMLFGERVRGGEGNSAPEELTWNALLQPVHLNSKFHKLSTKKWNTQDKYGLIFCLIQPASFSLLCEYPKSFFF